MFDTHRMLVSDEDYGEGDVKYDTPPYLYDGWCPTDEPHSYILICDVGKRFSLIDTASQVPKGETESEAPPYSGTYIKTTFTSGYFNTPASYVQPPDSPNVGYIVQSTMRIGATLGYVGTCDFNGLDLNTTNVMDTPVSGISYALFGQYGTYYPGNMYFTSQFKSFSMQQVVHPPLNTVSYAKTNNFMEETTTTSINSNVTNVTDVPKIAMYTNVYTNIRSVDDDDGSYGQRFTQPIYPTTPTINKCTASNVNIYPNESDNDLHALEIAAVQYFKPYVYSLGYPISLNNPKSSEVLEKVIANPRNFLRDNGDYARPMFKSYHIFGYDNDYTLTFDPGTIMGFTLIELMYYRPPSFSFAFYNTINTTDKNQIYSSGMYANTDMICADVAYTTTVSATAGFRYQVLRSKRGSIVVKYPPGPTYIMPQIIEPQASTPRQESDDLFYFVNGLNPEEYLFCDGVLFGRQQFNYSTFTRTSSEMWVSGGAWVPGTQNILLKGVTITYDNGLLSTSYSKITNGETKLDEWKFDDINISSVSHGIGAINQVVREFSYDPNMFDFRSYKSSCQAPYDVIFCDGAETPPEIHTADDGTSGSHEQSISDGGAVKIDGYLIAGMTSSQNLLDTIYDKIVNKAEQDVVLAQNTQNNPTTFEFSFEVYSIVLGTSDAREIYLAGISYEHVSIFPNQGIWMRVLTGKNKASHSISGRDFIYYDNSSNVYDHFLVKQNVTVKCTFSFNVNTSEGNTSVVFSDFPFGSCTSTLASARVKTGGVDHLVPLVINSLVIIGGSPILLGKLSLNDGQGLTFPKIVSYNGFVFTHSAKYVIMLDTNGVELVRDQINCVSIEGAEHTYIDRFDLLITEGMGNYLIAKYTDLSV